MGMETSREHDDGQGGRRVANFISGVQRQRLQISDGRPEEEEGRIHCIQDQLGGRQAKWGVGPTPPLLPLAIWPA